MPAIPQSVAGEPLFQDIVSRAVRLKAEAEVSARRSVNRPHRRLCPPR